MFMTKGATMASTNTTRELYRELAHRENDGVEVVLFWHQPTDELTVTVSDERNGAHFELAVEPHQALDVFNHPYAHAAFQGLCYEETSLTRGRNPSRGTRRSLPTGPIIRPCE
jgi:hypothetical protein